MYNTTKCCRVVAAVGNGAPYNVVFFFSLALKVAWSERVHASYHSFNGVLFSFFITNTKKKSPSRVSAGAKFLVISTEPLPMH